MKSNIQKFIDAEMTMTDLPATIGQTLADLDNQATWYSSAIYNYTSVEEWFVKYNPDWAE